MSQLAKIARPRLHQPVQRARLFGKLDDARERCACIFVVGPPGAGKTTLVASWLDSRKLAGIWYQLDPGDQDIASFFHYWPRPRMPVPAGRPPASRQPRACACGNLRPQVYSRVIATILLEASMSIAMTVEKYLRQMQVPYHILPHYRTGSSLETARVAHVPPHQLAKAVLLEDGDGYVMVVLPASEQIHFDMLREQLGRTIGLATEREVMEVFKDCDIGAIPPLGPAYGVPMVVDEELAREPELYFEGGSHVDLVHMDCAQYMKLCEGARRGRFCAPH